jgi:hypothetical protein
VAIKGKKKSQARGSQGQRRPAAAPRPVYTGRKHTPWYKTTEGRLVGGMILAVAIGVAIWLVADAQNKAEERSTRREALEGYVTDVRAFATTIGPVAEQMGLVPAGDPNVKTLKKDAKKWTADLTNAQAQVAVLTAPDDAEVANELFLQSLASFLSAARTYESAVGAEGDLQTELLAQANERRDQAHALFDLGVTALDEELAEVDGDFSNLSLPESTPPLPEPGESPGAGAPQDSTEVEIPAQPEGGDAGGGGGGGGPKKGGGDKGDGN